MEKENGKMQLCRLNEDCTSDIIQDNIATIETACELIINDILSFDKAFKLDNVQMIEMAVILYKGLLYDYKDDIQYMLLGEKEAANSPMKELLDYMEADFESKKTTLAYAEELGYSSN